MHALAASATARLPSHLRLGSAAFAAKANATKGELSVEASPVSPGAPRTLLVEKHGKPHHTYPRVIAPYPVNYDKAVLDADALDLALRLQVFDGSPTSISDIRLDTQSTHPRRCLDIGCASGDWILAASQCWPSATFVGIDLVTHQIPLHLLDPIEDAAGDAGDEERKVPSATRTAAAAAGSGSASGNQPAATTFAASSTKHQHQQQQQQQPPAPSSRIRWVQANFLTGLPFADGEFDYIHISGIARGVPEDKWDGLFAEISRVLAINGYIEMLEEDVIFPILPTDPTYTLRPTSPPAVLPLSLNVLGRHVSMANDATSPSRSSFSSNFLRLDSPTQEDSSRPPSLNATRSLGGAVPRQPVPPVKLTKQPSHQSLPAAAAAAAVAPRKEMSRPAEFPFATPSRSREPTTPKKRCNEPAIPKGWDGPPTPAASIVRAQQAQQQQSEVETESGRKASRRPRTASSVTSAFVSLSNKARRPSSAGSMSTRGGNKSKANFAEGFGTSSPPPSVPPLPAGLVDLTSPSSPRRFSHQATSVTSDVGQPPSALSSIPHDHVVLQKLFYGVFDGRFINTTPTSILPSFFNMYFQGVLSSPPIDFPVPPHPPLARENVRRDRRNMHQRELGSAGLEQSQGLSMNLTRPFAEVGSGKGTSWGLTSPSQTSNRRKSELLAAWETGVVDSRHVKRVKSSPGIAAEALRSSSAMRGSVSSASSSSIGYSDSPSSSKNTSFLPTPVTAQWADPYVQGSRSGSPFSKPGNGHQLRRYPSSSYLSDRIDCDEDEADAKLAIMGDGGCFSAEEDKKERQGGRTLSAYPSIASLRSEPDAPRTRTPHNWLVDDEALLLDALDGLGADMMEKDDSIVDFDILAAEELEVFDLIAEEGEDERHHEESPWINAQQENAQRTFVRPRSTFAGQGMPVPPQLLQLDDLSMGVHLTRAWLNVVACKEAMWDELQRKARVVPSNSSDPSSPTSSRRTTMLDEIDWKGSEVNMSDREKFELLFLRFEDDMRHWADVGSAIPQKLSWIDPRYPNLGPVPSLSSNKRHTASKASILSSPGTSRVTYPWEDDARGPGKNGSVILGLDVCRTLRVFTGRKIPDMRSPGGNAAKILGVL